MKSIGAQGAHLADVPWVRVRQLTPCRVKSSNAGAIIRASANPPLAARQTRAAKNFDEQTDENEICPASPEAWRSSSTRRVSPRKRFRNFAEQTIGNENYYA
jgi:hypothetical protein